MDNVPLVRPPRWLKPSKALIQLSLRGKSDDHFWFTFFHEAGHILLHGKKEIYIEAQGNGRQEIERISKEKEADLFAQEMLIPKETFKSSTRWRSKWGYK